MNKKTGGSQNASHLRCLSNTKRRGTNVYQCTVAGRPNIIRLSYQQKAVGSGEYKIQVNIESMSMVQSNREGVYHNGNIC